MRLRLTRLILVLCGGLFLHTVPLVAETPAVLRAEQAAAHNTTAYTLPPEKLVKAKRLARLESISDPLDTLWSLVQLALILTLGVAAKMRDLVVRSFRRRWMQGYSFVFLLVSLTTLLELPIDIYRHHVSVAYGFSVQGWGSWLGDQAKSLALAVAIGGLLVLILFWVIRRSPARWWLWFWMVAAAFAVAGVFITPYVIDPMFNHFEPLTKSDPALVQQLETVVQRGGMNIPPERMFLMKASAKTTTLNAYVTGFGASKRVVVWDTTIAKATPEEVEFIFAHEMGHYALGHVVLGLSFLLLLLLLFFWLGFHGMQLLLRRYGAAWGIPSQQDWAALVVLFFVVSVLSVISQPLMNGFSRILEHNADIYGQEAVHGLVGDPQTVGRAAFQVLGEDSLDDPTPHPLLEFWTGSHPPIRTRAAFASIYDPWAAGYVPKYFPK